MATKSTGQSESKGRKQAPENKAVEPVDDKAQDQVDEPEEEQPEAEQGDKPKVKAVARPRFDWVPINDDSKEAAHGHWRVRVQRLGATGLWRPMVEYVAVDLPTEDDAEHALEMLLQ